jgi:CelD/BcsL family acetyltransferase involved in cellulose biosynthesis
VSHFALVGTLEPELWEAFVQQHPKGTIFHTPAMYAVFQATRHYTPYFLAAINPHGEVIALLLAVRIQTLPDPLGWVSSRSIWYAEPLCTEDDLGLAALTALIRRHDQDMRHRVLFTEVRPIWPAGAEREALESCGYTYYAYLNFMLDLTRPPEQIFNGMIKSCRADIRRSKKRGLIVDEQNTPVGVDLLYHFASLSYDRSRVPLADRSLFDAALRLLPPGTARIFIAYYEGTPLAADIILYYKQLVYAWYGGVQRVRGVAPVECLTWHGIEQGCRGGYTHYDFGGAGVPDEPYGPRDFKAKFGGELVNYGRYRKIYNPRKLALAEHAYELRRTLQKHWHTLHQRITTKGEPHATPATPPTEGA